MPSAPQKRFSANGRSADTQTTAALSRPAASSLKRRTLAAQTPVSTLGKMLRTTRLPSGSVTSSRRFVPVRVYAGAGAPTAGRSPTVWTVVSPREVVAMDVSNTDGLGPPSLHAHAAWHVLAAAAGWCFARHWATRRLVA